MNWKLLIAALLVALAGSFALACGSDDGSDDGNGDEPEATAVIDDGEEPDNGEEPDDSNEPSNGGASSATLTIGEETWTFSDLFCGFSPEETRNDGVSFTLGAFGESADGVRIQLDVTIQDRDEQGRYEGEGVIHSVSVNDVEDFENPSVAWEATDGFISTQIADIIQVDGKNVTASGVFDDGRTDIEIEEVAGTFEGTCP